MAQDLLLPSIPGVGEALEGAGLSTRSFGILLILTVVISAFHAVTSARAKVPSAAMSATTR
jgi:hypothetical protein